MTPWLDMSKVAIFPTLDDETRARRAMRQRAVAYSDLRKERQRQSMMRRVHHASAAKAPHHRLHDGGVV
jgi:hypothetical protein